MRYEPQAPAGTSLSEGIFQLNRQFGALLLQRLRASLSGLHCQPAGADLAAFGRPFIRNPDLVRRLREHALLNPFPEDNLYGGGAKGYIDYPSLDATGQVLSDQRAS